MSVNGENVEKELSGQMELLEHFDEAPRKDPVKASLLVDKEDKDQQGDFDKGLSTSVKTVLVLDTETTGLDEQKEKCIEIGSILFHVKSRCVLAQQSFLLPCKNNNAELINKIPSSITRYPQPFEEGLQYFKCLVSASDVILAHNAEFDRKWFGVGDLPKIAKPWICSMEDIAWPEERQLRSRPSVRDLALAYGVPVWNAHRALTDCIYLAEVLARCSDLETLLVHALEPRRLVKANISYEQRHLAKQAGFRWNDPLPKAWSRRLSEREIERLKFPVSPVP